jgi:hypothetical protein
MSALENLRIRLWATAPENPRNAGKAMPLGSLLCHTSERNETCRIIQPGNARSVPPACPIMASRPAPTAAPTRNFDWRYIYGERSFARITGNAGAEGKPPVPLREEK